MFTLIKFNWRLREKYIKYWRTYLRKLVTLFEQQNFALDCIERLWILCWKNKIDWKKFLIILSGSSKRLIFLNIYY
jgi:hypothetical protein